jgi:hypothetical protein
LPDAPLVREEVQVRRTTANGRIASICVNEDWLDDLRAENHRLLEVALKVPIPSVAPGKFPLSFGPAHPDSVGGVFVRVLCQASEIDAGAGIDLPKS